MWFPMQAVYNPDRHASAFKNSALQLYDEGSAGDGLGQWYMSWINRGGDLVLLRGWSGSCAWEGSRIRGEKLCAVSR
jgi:hypothetical protein